MAETASAIDQKLVNRLTEEQMARFREHTGTSAAYYERARKVMPGGVPSSFQENDPWPVYIERGEGALVWDVDGSEYVDFHNGFGVMCIGHANPTVGAAVKARVDQGTHFAAPTEGSIVVAEASPSGDSPTRGPSRRWTPSTWRAGSPAATTSSRSRAHTTDTTTR